MDLSKAKYFRWEVRLAPKHEVRTKLSWPTYKNPNHAKYGPPWIDDYDFQGKSTVETGDLILLKSTIGMNSFNLKFDEKETILGCNLAYKPISSPQFVMFMFAQVSAYYTDIVFFDGRSYGQAKRRF